MNLEIDDNEFIKRRKKEFEYLLNFREELGVFKNMMSDLLFDNIEENQPISLNIMKRSYINLKDLMKIEILYNNPVEKENVVLEDKENNDLIKKKNNLIGKWRFIKSKKEYMCSYLEFIYNTSFQNHFNLFKLEFSNIFQKNHVIFVSYNGIENRYFYGLENDPSEKSQNFMNPIIYNIKPRNYDLDVERRYHSLLFIDLFMFSEQLNVQNQNSGIGLNRILADKIEGIESKVIVTSYKKNRNEQIYGYNGFNFENDFKNSNKIQEFVKSIENGRIILMKYKKLNFDSFSFYLNKIKQNQLGQLNNINVDMKISNIENNIIYFNNNELPMNLNFSFEYDIKEPYFLVMLNSEIILKKNNDSYFLDELSPLDWNYSSYQLNKNNKTYYDEIYGSNQQIFNTLPLTIDSNQKIYFIKFIVRKNNNSNKTQNPNVDGIKKKPDKNRFFREEIYVKSLLIKIINT